MAANSSIPTLKDNTNLMIEDQVTNITRFNDELAEKNEPLNKMDKTEHDIIKKEELETILNEAANASKSSQDKSTMAESTENVSSLSPTSETTKKPVKNPFLAPNDGRNGQ